MGVFDIRDIAKGINPFGVGKKERWAGFSLNELKSIDKKVLKMIKDFFVLEENKVYIPENGLNGINISFFVNHSDKLNVKYSENKKQFLTIRRVNADEELTQNYKFYKENWSNEPR